MYGLYGDDVSHSLLGCDVLEGHAVSIFTLMMKSARSSKMLVSYYITSQCHSLEDFKFKVPPVFMFMRLRYLFLSMFKQGRKGS